jgi:hypothetical protein
MVVRGKRSLVNKTSGSNFISTAYDLTGLEYAVFKDLRVKSVKLSDVRQGVSGFTHREAGFRPGSSGPNLRSHKIGPRGFHKYLPQAVVQWHLGLRVHAPC